MRELKAFGDKIDLRVSELTARPIAVAMVSHFLSTSRELLANISKERELKEEDEEDTIEMIESLEKWLQEKMEAQEKLAAHEDPAFTSDLLNAKWKAVDAQLKILSRRPRKKPPKIEVPANDTATNSTERIVIEEAQPCEGENCPPKEESQEQPSQDQQQQDAGNQQPTSEEIPQNQEPKDEATNAPQQEEGAGHKHDEL